MLSKYNLHVGVCTSTSDSNYGLQSEDATDCKENVSFSGSCYWNENGSPKSKYPGSYEGPDHPNVYDTDYIDAMGANYSVAYYVEQYRSVLANYGLNIQSARLLVFAEAQEIGCNTYDSNFGYSCI